MSRNEFLKILRESLEISLDNNLINEQVDYYDKYISDEINKGRTEKEVLDELGDPRLIAKTIKTVNNADGMVINENLNGNSEDPNSNNTDNINNQNRRTFYGNLNTNSTIGCIIALLVMFIICSLIIKFFSYMFVGLISFIQPMGIGAVILVVLAIWFVFGRK